MDMRGEPCVCIASLMPGLQRICCSCSTKNKKIQQIQQLASTCGFAVIDGVPKGRTLYSRYCHTVILLVLLVYSLDTVVGLMLLLILSLLARSATTIVIYCYTVKLSRVVAALPTTTVVLDTGVLRCIGDIAYIQGYVLTPGAVSNAGLADGKTLLHYVSEVQRSAHVCFWDVHC